MADNFGLKIGIEGEKEFKNALRDINQSFKVLGSEMKLVSSAFDKQDKSIAATAARNEVLSKSIDAQKDKISTLEAALKNASDSFGENDRRTQNWQIALNNANSELNNMERELKESTEEADNLSRGLEDAGDSAEKSVTKFEKLGAILKGIGVAIGASVVAAGAAAFKLGKEVISAYADYEQLIGGVDTLFDEASQTVQRYAENAYKTAGMSANAYMETVTGFSASLIQSLGGDTAKAAQIADMVITDMSDNANKMGTDISSIQNAYQGFAKQNYTMLDNLKLGYGGTKSEMERLLADAEKISGIKYDLSSFSDLMAAIHVIQTEMGITGTTALEATETISGSISGMKSAIGNLTAGLGNANANIGVLIGNVVESFQNVVKNIVPVIENIVKALPPALDGVLKAIGDLLPTLLSMVTELFSQVLATLLTLLPSLIPAAVSAVMTITTAIIDSLPLLMSAAVELVTALVLGIGSALPELVPAAVSAVTTVVHGLLDNLPMLLDAALQLILGLTRGMLDALPQLIAAMPAIITEIVDFIIGSIPQIIEAGILLFVALVQNLPAIIVEIVKAVPQIISALVGGFMDSIGQIVQVGTNLIQGLWQGISDAGAWLWEKISGFFGGVVDKIKGFFGIHSPSTLFAGLGANMAQGLGDGFGDEMGGVGDDMLTATKTAGDAAGLAAIDAVKDGILDHLSLLTGSVMRLVTHIGETISQNSAVLKSSGFDIVRSLASGIEESQEGTILEKIRILIQRIKETFDSFKQGFINIGQMIMEGIGSGITSRSRWLNNLVSSYILEMKRRVEAMLQINSPSRVFAEIGGYMAEGMGVGFEKAMSGVKTQIERSIPTELDVKGGMATDMVNGLVGGLSSALGGGLSKQKITLQVNLDGKTIAQTIFDPLKDVSKQRGVTLG